MSLDDYPLYGGVPPHVHGSDTSLDAAQKIKPKLTEMHDRILSRFAEGNGELIGWTCYEIETYLKMKHQTASARLRELVVLDKIEDSKLRRKTSGDATARVYVLSEKESLW